MNIKNEWENLSRKEQAFILACFERSKENTAKKENNQQSPEEMHKKSKPQAKGKYSVGSWSY